jgi:hypothetical protein
MANAPVLKTGVRKDLGVRIPRPPLALATFSVAGRALARIGTTRHTVGTLGADLLP